MSQQQRRLDKKEETDWMIIPRENPDNRVSNIKNKLSTTDYTVAIDITNDSEQESPSSFCAQSLNKCGIKQVADTHHRESLT